MAVKRASSGKTAQTADDLAVRRHRILDAAFSAFMKDGYSNTSTLDIATRARVSKRALYELVGSKQEMLAACINERARQLRFPADLPTPSDRQGLGQVLTAVGAQLLHEIGDPSVIAVFRLAIAEAINAPEVAWALDSIGRETSRAALRDVMTRAQAKGLIEGNPTDMSEQFSGLLWGNLLVSLLLRVVERPTEQEIDRRARAAASAFLMLHPSPI